MLCRVKWDREEIRSIFCGNFIYNGNMVGECIDSWWAFPRQYHGWDNQGAVKLQFTRLKLNGFKSFVDPTDLPIGTGLTGVVGPNGCGKSNLLEALRWVMGETRPTAMRGGGMDDVIFSGSASRPARNFAEVVVYIDNSERLAPSAFNSGDHLEISRRITRDIGSAFKVNSRDLRSRDVQMLFADASTGAHSPALVRQGQISELINAKPRSRRRVLEEAAGISGLYQRRHEAELKLNGAEVNLQRVNQVIEQLAVQLAQLARQARQASRYREIARALRNSEGLLLYGRWREAEDARVAAENVLRERMLNESSAERDALASRKLRVEREEVMPALRESEAAAAAALQRLTVELNALTERESRASESILTLTARVAQLAQDIEREETLKRDAGETASRLEVEANGLRKLDEGHDAALAACAGEAREAARDLQECENALAQVTEDTARLAARHQSAQRLMDDARKTLEHSESEAIQSRSAQRDAEAALKNADMALREATARHSAAVAEAELAESALVEADNARADAQALEAGARAARSEAESEAGTLRTEVAALSKLLERETSGTEQLLDIVRISPGREKALGAALSDDLRVPEIDPDDRTGWVRLPDYKDVQPLPDGVEALAPSVTAPSVLERRIKQVGLVDRTDGHRLQRHLKPGQRLVSPEGDLWRWDGFRAGAEDAPNTAALRLEQLNRLEQLRRELVPVTARSEGAAQAHERLKKSLTELTEADRKAREEMRAADMKMTEASRTLSRNEAARNIAEGNVESLRLAAARHHESAGHARDAVRDAEDTLGDLEDLEAARAEMENVKVSVEAARTKMMSRRAAHNELKHEGDVRAKRLREVSEEISGWKLRLANAGRRVEELVKRLKTSEEDLVAARGVPGQIVAQRDTLADSIECAKKHRTDVADALALGEAALREASDAERKTERAASDIREARAAAEARSDAALEAVQHAACRITEERQTTPEALLEDLGVEAEAMHASEQIEREVNRLKRQRDALGAVNLRAEEDARAVQEEHDGMLGEKEDLEVAIGKLRTGITALNQEGRERLLTAFEQVNSNFAMLFKHLFGGGEARLEMVEATDPLEAGLEIMCQPPGKKLSTLSLLSGGEQTLTALALIFAVFLANPAPICVLDEVDAPLDDANVSRFCDLLDEISRRTETRFLIITHHAITMARMDRLFGVTMAESGVSQLVSVQLKNDERLAS